MWKMKKVQELIKRKRGSMMMEAMILMVVGLIVLMAFIIFLDQGTRFGENSLRQIGSAQKKEDKGADLEEFRRIE